VTAPIPTGVLRPRVRLVSDGAYHSEVRALVAAAERSLLCSLFIVDPLPLSDSELIVDELLEDLAAARWRGVDVRLLLGGSRDNFGIAQTADLARARALQLDIPCRWLTSHKVRGSHAKFVVADDYVLTGSHNWSAGAFGDQTQDSVLVLSPDFAAHVAALFQQQWSRAFVK
jgi:phosphatidylserine/phosphatidylglycerophosphate/cardiolipin synthase-like enzyme